MSPPAQLPLFGPVAVHISCHGNCAVCRVSLAVAGAWDRWDGCHDCPGMVEPVSPWMTLEAVETAELEPMERAA